VTIAANPNPINCAEALSGHFRPALASRIPEHSTASNAECQTVAGYFLMLPGTAV
jgi:hypothetical protein